MRSGWRNGGKPFNLTAKELMIKQTQDDRRRVLSAFLKHPIVS